jgi:uncharacterized protein (DUF983 family)
MIESKTAVAPLAQQRDWPAALWRGFKGRCPHCGEGKLFRAFLKVVDRCEVCGTEFHHHRADDLPAYIVIFIMGHAVVGGMLAAESNYEWPLWIHVMLWPLLTLVGSLVLLQPVKGAIVGLQWALRMHGFGAHPDGDDHPALRPREDRAP